MDSVHNILRFEEFDNLEWISSQVVEGFITGLHRSPYHGFSVEFAEHRLYNTGESTKHIDWKLFARTDRLFVKKYEEETNLRCMLVLDTSSSMLFPYGDAKSINKLSYSVYSAAALIHLLRRQRDAVGLTLFSDKIDFQSQIKLSSSHAKMLYTELNKLLTTSKDDFNKKTNISEILHFVAESVHKRSLVIIFSDLFSGDTDALFSAVEHLRHNKHEVIIFHVTHKELEQQLSYNNRPVKFVDMETGEQIKLNPAEIRQYYTENLSQIITDFKMKCGQYNVEFVEADAGSDFREVLIPFLVKRKSMF